MSGLKAWQRILYYAGELVMLGGIGWAAYSMWVVKTCPSGKFTYLTLILVGLMVSVLPLHPFGGGGKPPAYITAWLGRLPYVAAAWWALSFCGALYGLYAQSARLPGMTWAVALLPAALYLWLGVTSKASDPLPAPAKGQEGRDG
jgi:hypothetical protein